jgi:flagellar hook assembly protein FlgD
MVYPNPWNLERDITIQYYLEKDADVEVRIYTLTGELVKRWPEFKAYIGVNLLEWDGADKDGNIVGSGGYICAVDKKYEGATERDCDFAKIAVIRK